MLPGSSPRPRPGETWLGPASSDQQVTVTIYLRRSSSEEPHQHATRQEGVAALAASHADLQTVRSFADQYGLRITAENPNARTVQLTGSVEQLDTAFGIQLGIAQDGEGNRYLTYQGDLTVPADLANVTTAVLGLDQARIARHHG